MFQSDKELVDRAKRKDMTAFTALFDKYSDRIISYLCRYTRNYHIAEDITIKTFLRAYKHLDSYSEMGTFSSWLYKIATNCLKSEMRKLRYKIEVPLEVDLEGADDKGMDKHIRDDSKRPDHAVRSEEFQEFLYDILSKIDQKYKDVLMLCDIEGLSYDEAASILNSNKQTIGTRLKRGRKILHDKLREYGYKV